jgi:MFS family permease
VRPAPVPASLVRATPWIVVASIWLTLGVAFGLFFSFPIFFLPLIEEFGWSRGATAGAFSLSAVVQGFGSPLVGALVDRTGPRRVMLAGAVLLGTACSLGALIDALWQLYVVTGVLTALGITAVGWVPTAALLAGWFRARRGTVMGLAFSGMGLGVLVLGPLAQWLITGQGWRRAYLYLGLGALTVLLPLAWLGIREAPPPADPGSEARPGSDRGAPGPDGIGVRGALRSRAFWGLFFAYLFTPLAVFPVVTHQVAFAVDQGFERFLVAGIFGLTGFMSVAGRIGFGLAADRIGRELSATISYACTAAGTLALLAVERWHHPAPLYAYAVLFGLGFGARGPIITAMAAQLFPGRRFGAIYGLMSVGNGLGGAFAPWFGGAIHDLTGSYRVAFLAAAGCCALGATCFWLARVPRQ